MKSLAKELNDQIFQEPSDDVEKNANIDWIPTVYYVDGLTHMVLDD